MCIRDRFFNRRKNGELYWENVLIAPIMDKNGKIFNFLALKEDITERKRAEKLLKESEEQHRLLFETAQEGIVVTLDGIFNYFNPAMLEITGYSGEELL